MSRWTHIVAAIDVDTFMENHNIKHDVIELLKYAPKITGSEVDAEVFVNVLGGHNISSWHDGIHEEFQTRVVITVVGDLRDRARKITEKEWNEFKEFIETKVDKEGWWIRNCSCNIMDEYENFLNNLDKGFLDIKVGDTVVVYDEYSHDYEEHYFKVESIEYDKENATETNPDGMMCYGTDLDCWNEEINDYDTDDYIGVVTEGNFVCFKKTKEK